MTKQLLWLFETHQNLSKITVKGGFCDGGVIATKIQKSV